MQTMHSSNLFNYTAYEANHQLQQFYYGLILVYHHNDSFFLHRVIIIILILQNNGVSLKICTSTRKVQIIHFLGHQGFNTVQHWSIAIVLTELLGAFGNKLVTNSVGACFMLLKLHNDQRLHHFASISAM